MKTAVLVIDLQVGLFVEAGVPHDFETTVNRINLITKYARENDFPVVFIQHEQPAAGLHANTADWELIPELIVEDHDHTIRKTTPNSFLKTDLDDLLTSLEVNRLIICGYSTEYCVDSTIRGGAALGYSIMIAADAHTSHDKDHATGEFIRNHHNISLSNIKSFGVKIAALPTEQIVHFP